VWRYSDGAAGYGRSARARSGCPLGAMNRVALCDCPDTGVAKVQVNKATALTCAHTRLPMLSCK
jgi:hypothetical protein